MLCTDNIAIYQCCFDFLTPCLFLPDRRKFTRGQNRIFNIDMGAVGAGNQDWHHVLLVYLYFVQDCMQHSFQDVGYRGPNRLCFPDVFHFSKKIGFLAARLVARNFTRALGYAKHPLSPLRIIALVRHRVGPTSRWVCIAGCRHCCWMISMLTIIPVSRHRWGAGGLGEHVCWPMIRPANVTAQILCRQRKIWKRCPSLSNG